MKKYWFGDDLADITVHLRFGDSFLVERGCVTLLHIFCRKRAQHRNGVMSGKYDPPDKARLLVNHPCISSCEGYRQRNVLGRLRSYSNNSVNMSSSRNQLNVIERERVADATRVFAADSELECLISGVQINRA